MEMFHLIAGALALVGGTVIVMTIIFGNYILEHLLVPAMKREKGLGLFSDLAINFTGKMQYCVVSLWLLAAVVLCIFVPYMETTATKVLIAGLGAATVMEAFLAFPRFWQVSLKQPEPKEEADTKTTEKGGQDAGT